MSTNSTTSLIWAMIARSNGTVGYRDETQRYIIEAATDCFYRVTFCSNDHYELTIGHRQSVAEAKALCEADYAARDGNYNLD